MKPFDADKYYDVNQHRLLSGTLPVEGQLCLTKSSDSFDTDMWYNVFNGEKWVYAGPEKSKELEEQYKSQQTLLKRHPKNPFRYCNF
jgi:hypothetical protein